MGEYANHHGGWNIIENNHRIIIHPLCYNFYRKTVSLSVFVYGYINPLAILL